VHRFLAVWGTALLVVAASAPIATVTASGPINISGAAVPATAASSAPLGLGDRISTIDSPALIRFEGRGVVTLDKRSSVQIVSRGGRTMICLLDGAYLYKFVAGSALDVCKDGRALPASNLEGQVSSAAQPRLSISSAELTAVGPTRKSKDCPPAHGSNGHDCSADK
jgi:hypothetical protein